MVSKCDYRVKSRNSCRFTYWKKSGILYRGFYSALSELENLFDDEEAPANIIEDETNNEESIKEENQLIVGHANKKLGG